MESPVTNLKPNKIGSQTFRKILFRVLRERGKRGCSPRGFRQFFAVFFFFTILQF